VKRILAIAGLAAGVDPAGNAFRVVGLQARVTSRKKVRLD
jgi:hypothetical protein